ncbi:hypothetical protein EV426DRAFT_720438 [Tirmania nivea]|nr:hypothetical protein EV426DRAFT_720438 [Tirmania nivea]
MSMLTGAAGFFHSSSSLVTMSIPQASWAGPSSMSILQAPRPGPSAQTTSQKPRATSVLKLQNSSRWTAIPALSKVDSEGPDVAQDIIHFNALCEAGKQATTLNTSVRRHQYTREFKLAAITYAKEHTSPSIDLIIEAVIPRRFSKYYVAQILADSDIHIEGISNYTVPDWQLPPELEDQLDLPIDTEDESSDLEIVDNEEEVDGSDNEQGDYIIEEEAMQYATITLGEEIV